MNTKIRKLTTLILSMLLVVNTLTACSSSQKGNTLEKTKEKILVRFVMPGDAGADEAKVEEAINKKMEKDGMNLQYKAMYIPWDVWEQKTNLMMNTGEPFELLQVMDSWISTSSIVGKGGIIPIGAAYLDKYGQHIKKLIPEIAFEAGKVNGKIYTVPAYALEPAFRTGFITYRKDLFEKYNISIPKNPEDLSTAIETVIKGEKDQKLMYIPDDGDFQDMLHRWYDSYPFIVHDQLLSIKGDGTVKSWVETDDFRKDCAFNRKLYVDGIISPDILSLKDDIKANSSKNAMFAIQGEEALGWSPQQKLGNPNAKVDDFFVAPEKPIMRNTVYTNSNAISATSPHPEAGVQFLDWVYTSQENYDLLHYGLKDIHWKDLGDKKFEPINPEKPKYTYNTWMSENIAFSRNSKDIHPSSILINEKKFPGINYNVQNFVTLGFTFDTTNIATEYANCMSEANTGFRPLANGVVDFDKNYPKALAKMKAAGIDKVVAEYEKQLKNFLAAKTK